MKFVVGLGNPGPKYQLTRHNIGFLFIDACVERFAGNRQYKTEFKAETQKITVAGHPVLVCKPQTFMNNSGDSVQAIMHFYGIDPADLIVAHDEVDQPFGHLKFQIRRGHGGHNGIRDIHQKIATDDYSRLRLGVGRPPVIVNDEGKPVGATQAVADWVLSPFANSEQAQMPGFLDTALRGLEAWMIDGIEKAAALFNSHTSSSNTAKEQKDNK